MIDEHDDKDYVTASMRSTILEMQKLAALSVEFMKDIDSKNGQELLIDLIALVAQNTTVTMSLTNAVITHMGVTGYLKGEVKLHS